MIVVLLQKQVVGANTWQAGMRLEALDRKTPTLICVATVGMQTSFVSSVQFVLLIAFPAAVYLCRR